MDSQLQREELIDDLEADNRHLRDRVVLLEDQPRAIRTIVCGGNR